jgi:N-hydroxyarylamine O-acetyltransferase
MDVQQYLHRVGYKSPVRPDRATLSRLHRAHLLAVPFENLDIMAGRRIILDEAWFYEKIVSRQRGGFCYELNGLFACLLREIGFRVDLLSARMRTEGGVFGPPLDHLALLVHLDEPWLADVAGVSFTGPLRLASTGRQMRSGRAWRIVAHEGERLLQRRDAEGWRAEYLFALEPRTLADFERGCRFHQTSPDSPFTRQHLCSLTTRTGRITLSGNRFIETVNDVRSETALVSEDEAQAILRERFGLLEGAWRRAPNNDPPEGRF